MGSPEIDEYLGEAFEPPPVDAPLEVILELGPFEFDAWLSQEGAAERWASDQRPAVLDVPDDPEQRRQRFEELIERGEPRGELDGRALLRLASSDRLPKALKAEVRRLVQAAGQIPGERSAALLHRAGRLIAGAEAELLEAEPFGRVVRSTQYIGGDGAVRVKETDGRGRQRERVVADVDLDEFGPGAAPRVLEPEPEVLHEVTPEVVREWSADRWLEFRRRYPQAADQLLQGREVHDSRGFTLGQGG